VNSRETRIGTTVPAGRHRRMVTPTTDKGSSWYTPTARVTLLQLVSRPANHQPAPPADPRHMRARSRATGTTPTGLRLVHTHGPSHDTYGRAHTQTGVVPGTYPRPRSRAVRLILGLDQDTRPNHPARAGQRQRTRKNTSRGLNTITQSPGCQTQ
jgi:hypothetical protein